MQEASQARFSQSPRIIKTTLDSNSSQKREDRKGYLFGVRLGGETQRYTPDASTRARQVPALVDTGTTSACGGASATGGASARGGARGFPVEVVDSKDKTR